MNNVYNTKNLLEEDRQLKKFVSILKYKNMKLEPKGSSTLKYIRYPADFDFYTYITLEDPKLMYNDLQKIYNRVEKNKKIWFINMSVGKHSDKEGRIVYEKFPNEEEFLNYFKDGSDIDYIQFEYVIEIMDTIKPMTTDFYLYEKKNEEKVLVDLKNAIEDYIKKKNYMKALKRIFNEVQILEPNSIKAKKIIDFFNSDIGKIYMDKINLETIKNVLKKYPDDDDLISDCIKNLKHLGETKGKNLDLLIDEYDNKINIEAKKILDSL